jgi:hypothetical protein
MGPFSVFEETFLGVKINISRICRTYFQYTHQDPSRFLKNQEDFTLKTCSANICPSHDIPTLTYIHTGLIQDVYSL